VTPAYLWFNIFNFGALPFFTLHKLHYRKKTKKKDENTVIVMVDVYNNIYLYTVTLVNNIAVDISK